MAHQVYVHGAAVRRSWRDARMNLNDFIFATVTDALADARVSIDDVDSVILGAHDVTDGRGLSSMVTAPSAGAFMKDEVRLGDDGAQAFVVGAARVVGGASKCAIVVAWGRASEGEPEAISNILFDPFFTRPLGMTEVGVSSLRAAAALAKHRRYEASRNAAAARRSVSRFAMGRVADSAHPLRDGELPVWADVAAAVVISCELSRVRVSGVGMSTEPYGIGDRDLLGLPALRSASQQALERAGTDVGKIEVFELDGLTLVDEALALEAVGAVAEGEGMPALAGEGSDRVVINRDGGYVAGYCAPAMGLVRIAGAAAAIRDGAGSAIATGSSAVASQSQTAVALRRG
ncbi:MAG: hypothetical protein QM714_16085 [Nocardioides sp.]|uniref:thiolase C-terminal domain-containing protein n=1 Tax=Nocardioides sp. TaxID=35761 RepID=UPI0039E5C4B6